MKGAVLLTCCFFLFIQLFEYSSTSASTSVNNELRLIHREIGLLKDENKNQNDQIEMLLEMMGSSPPQWRQGNNHQLLERNEEPIDHQMKKNDNDEFLLTPSGGDPLHDSSWKGRLKRPARLLPLQLLFDRKKDTDQGLHRFYGPPTNCSELSILGYTLNGFYLVKIADITNETKLETVYCAFKQSDGTFNPSGSEKRGARFNSDIIQTNNKKVGGGIHFYAQVIKDRQSSFRLSGSSIVEFDTVYLNMGGAFYGKTGTFTTPKNGVYQFIFKRTMRKEESSAMIVMYRNSDLKSITIPSGDSNMIVATLKLTKGDRCYMKTVFENPVFTLRGDTTASFSGSLLEELD